MSSANYPPASQLPATGRPRATTTPDPLASDWPVAHTSRTTYRPTTEQLARDEARRRYLRRNVYTPVIIAAIIAVGLFVLLFVLAFAIRTPQAASFIAGMSALVIILIATPLIALMAVAPIAWLAFKLNRRQQRKNNPETGPMAYRSRIQILLWQLDGLLDGLQDGAIRIGERVRRPLIALHARAAYLRQWLNGLWDKFTRSNDYGHN
ncbi:MAG: magnesium transporter [Candidatus Promineofilum sp.]|nr:magnesium transporter [Promineifilum sp.]